MLQNRSAPWRLPKAIITRLPDIALILVSAAIIALVGFGPLLGRHDRHDAIAQDCELFYRSSGQSAVTHCMTEMVH